MARSVWKGPFVHPSLIKTKKARMDLKDQSKTWSRNSTIIPEFVDISLKYIMVKNLFLFLFQRKW